MEIVGPDRHTTSRSVSLTVKGLRTLDSVEVTAELGGPKLAGTKGVAVGLLLDRVVRGDALGAGVTGTYEAADGATTDPIDLAELRRGVLVHTGVGGEGDLPASLGGPLRVVHPAGCAVQATICKTKTSPVNVKGVVKLVLVSAYEAREAKLVKALSTMAPRLIMHMNDDHADSLLAYAVHYAQLPTATKASMVGMDARGFTLKVDDAAGGSCEVLVPFPRPLEGAADVRKYAVEMHHAAFGALGARFKLRHGYYTSAARHAAAGVATMAKRKPVAAAALVAVAAGVGAVVLAAVRRRGR
jgi:hypothetical protein